LPEPATRELAALGDDRIIIDSRPSNDYRVLDQRYLAIHGDMMGVKGGDGIIGAIGPIMRGSLKVRDYGAATNQEHDMLVLGHWHQPLCLPRAIVANTLKGTCESGEFVKNVLRAPPTKPS
jgi:hypothetical protein